MKRIFPFITWLLLLILAGCASSGHIQGAGPITAKPFDLNVIWVKTSSSLADVTKEKQVLADQIVSGLKETVSFNRVGEDKADLGPGSGIALDAKIIAIKKISPTQRAWAGALAGRARIQVQVTVTDINSGKTIERFAAEGASSGGSNLAGTTEEAIERAADAVVGEVLRINALTAE